MSCENAPIFGSGLNYLRSRREMVTAGNCQGNGRFLDAYAYYQARIQKACVTIPVLSQLRVLQEGFEHFHPVKHQRILRHKDGCFISLTQY